MKEKIRQFTSVNEFCERTQFIYVNNKRVDLDILLAYHKNEVLIWNNGKGVVVPYARLMFDLRDVLPKDHYKAVEYLTATMKDAADDKNYDPEKDVIVIGMRKEMSRTDIIATRHIWATDYRLTGDPANPIVNLEPVLDVFNQKYENDPAPEDE